MSVFSATEIAPVMYICGDRMKKLSNLLFDDNQAQLREQYMKDCDKNNGDGINKAIDKAFCNLLHSQSLMKGLMEFAKKFPELNIEVESEIFEKDVIVKLAQHSGEMLQIIDQNRKAY